MVNNVPYVEPLVGQCSAPMDCTVHTDGWTELLQKNKASPSAFGRKSYFMIDKRALFVIGWAGAGVILKL